VDQIRHQREPARCRCYVPQLDLHQHADDNRRVLAVLAYLGGT